MIVIEVNFNSKSVEIIIEIIFIQKLYFFLAVDLI
jgi:hypothetical protein